LAISYDQVPKVNKKGTTGLIGWIGMPALLICSTDGPNDDLPILERMLEVVRPRLQPAQFDNAKSRIIIFVS
jgi:hypothetical protein